MDQDPPYAEPRSVGAKVRARCSVVVSLSIGNEASVELRWVKTHPMQSSALLERRCAHGVRSWCRFRSGMRQASSFGGSRPTLCRAALCWIVTHPMELQAARSKPDRTPNACEAPSPLSPHSSLLTPHSSLLTPHSSLLTPHSSPLITPHPSPLTPHPSPLTPHPSPLTPHPSPLTPHPLLLTPHSSPLVPLHSLPAPSPHAPTDGRWSAGFALLCSAVLSVRLHGVLHA